MLKENNTTPETYLPATRSLLYDIVTVINTVYQSTLEPTVEGKIPKRISKKLLPLLKGNVLRTEKEMDAYLALILDVLNNSGILTYIDPDPTDEKKKLYLAPGVGMETWQRMNSIKQAQFLLSAWARYSNWKDTAILPVESGRATFFFYDMSGSELRPLVLEQLRQCHENTWYRLEDFIRRIGIVYHTAERTNSPADFVELETEVTRPISLGRRNYETWVEHNTPVIANMFFTTLYETGLVEPGYHGKRLDRQHIDVLACVFRLTEDGKAILAIDKAIEPEDVKPVVIVQPNYEMLLLELHLPTLYRVLPFAQLKQIDQVSTFVLTQDSLANALKKGLRFEKDVLSVLQKVSQKELPQNVLYSLQDWAKHCKVAYLSPVLLIEVDNDALGQQLAADETLRSLNVRSLAPNLFTIQFSDPEQMNLPTFRDALEKLGVSLSVKAMLMRDVEDYDDDDDDDDDDDYHFFG
ncbi:helicase-associated domain-containing protein [Dictyobacter arantiisoli]|uniref:Helicase XPB/Ssl2 N-terminal domain-containing protein n=1 Tax=Dictyobacter arantiisoli TaxID=2014874 RepID=A0A5A5T6Z0_9CHLR|nr:helicase-associated domain-containing protein [Dictyobacter arantiisoli]GCF07167.1 hypothetical protein KDI_07310 [Dictyobacter arantiisoli]